VPSVQTLLLLSSATDAQPLLAELLGEQTSIIPVAPPAEPTREKFDALLSTWLRLVDAVFVDAVSLGETARWAFESLAAARLEERHAVVVRATALQLQLYPAGQGWLVVSDQDSPDRLKQLLLTFLELRHAQARLKQAEAVIARQRQAGTIGAAAGEAATLQPRLAVETGSVAGGLAFDWYRYRDALKSLSRLLGQRHDQQLLLWEFLNLVAELLGLSKLAIFMRPFQAGLFNGQSGPAGGHLPMAVHRGIAQEVVGHFRLRLESGIGGCLAKEARVLRRSRQADPLALDYDAQVAREFDLLGTEVAVPIFDNDQLLGVLTFGGKIVGVPLTNEELELVYALMSQLAQAIRNLHLLDQISDQQHFMSEVLTNIQTGVVVVSRDSRILHLNKRVYGLLNLGAQDLVGQRANMLPPVVADTIFEALETGREIRQREVALPPEGRPLGITATPMVVRLGGDPEKESGSVAVALIEDLAETRLREAQARELSEKEFFMRVASQMSHELKNAMVSVKTFAQQLPERYQDEEFREYFRNVVINDIARMDLLLNTLTCFAHPLALSCEPIDLAELIESSLKNVSQEMVRKHSTRLALTTAAGAITETDVPVVTVQRALGFKEGRLEGDRIRLQQALEQIIRNAVQAMPAGGRLAVATAEAQAADFPDQKLPDGGAVRIEWKDTGEGISLENLKRVTDPFYTTRNVGIGLGLPMVKKIVERHGGQLEIDSLLGRGTTVTVVLPVRAQLAGQDAMAGRSKSASASASAASGQRLPETVGAAPAK